MGKKRREHSSKFKAKVALDAVKEQETIAMLATKYGIHPTQLSHWKKQLLEGAERIFEGEYGHPEKDYEAEQARLYQEIGRLTTELSWLKKKM